MKRRAHEHPVDAVPWQTGVLSAAVDPLNAGPAPPRALSLLAHRAVWFHGITLESQLREVFGQLPRARADVRHPKPFAKTARHTHKRAQYAV